jgi:TPR repeat protein
MTSALRYAHTALWRSDAWYRRCCFTFPQLIAAVVAGWLLAAPAGGAPPAGAGAGGWGNPVPQGTVDSEAYALRDRAETDQAAFASLKAQADAGNAVMQFCFGTLYDVNLKLGKINAPDMPTALRYYLLAAQQGTMVAAYDYGNSLTFGYGVPKDPATGLPWLLKAANANYITAQRVLGMVYRDGVAGQTDRASATAWFQKAADAGDHYSQAEIGWVYWNGFAPYAKNQQTAVQWYLRSAADPTEGYAMRMLGIAYRDGTGAAADHTTAMQWFQKGADAGDHYAQYEIANAYWNGIAPYAKNPQSAVEWYLKAAVDPTQVVSERQLGIAYRDGTGAVANKTTSLQWFQKAADSGDHYAQTEIADAYWNGYPPYPRNPSLAVQWYMKAAVDPNESGAMRMLGSAYADGNGIGRDINQARYWLQQAVSHGDQDAGQILNKLR